MKATLGNPFGGMPPFRPGDEVKIVSGPFVDYLGVVESVDGVRGKLSVLISVFGRDVVAELGFGDVRKV